MFLLFFNWNATAQFGNVWTFGFGFGVDFNSGQPIQLPPNAMASVEGCSSVCDSTGQLLFYTNGESIWDRYNNIMPNGDSIGGHQSSTQSAIIVPFPNHPNQYYVFTTNIWGNFGTREMDFSIVDMSLNNSNGGVVTKNQFLEDSVGEKLSATRHCNGQDWWIVIKKGNSDNFVSFLLSPVGLANTPVVSNSTYPIAGTCGSQGHLYGQMKLSPNGKFLACAYAGCGLELFSFNNFTGVVGNVLFRELLFPSLKIYGLSFTANSKNLVAGYHLDLPFPIPDEYKIAKYSLDTLSQQSIAQSRTFIILNDSLTPSYDQVFGFGSFQLGPNEEIYGIGTVLDTILGGPKIQLFRIGSEANNIIERLPFYFPTGIDIGNGLPNTYDGIYTNHHKASLRLPLCNSPFPFDSIPFFDSLLTVTRDYSWDFGDPASGSNNYSNLQHPIHQYSSTGTYMVTLTLESDCNPIVVAQQVLVTQVPVSIPLISMNMGQLESTPANNYQWFLEGAPINGAVFQQYFPVQIGNYTVQVSNSSGCTATSLPFNVTAVQLRELQLFTQFSILQYGQQIKLQCNPISDCFQIVELIDLQGRILQTYSYQQKQSQVELDLSELPSGVYLLRVNGREVRKVVFN